MFEGLFFGEKPLKLHKEPERFLDAATVSLWISVMEYFI